jgi:hypothetical protein
MAQSGLLFEIVHMNEETTRWQLVTSANPGSALRLLEPFFVCWQGGICLRAGRAHPANAPAPFAPNGTSGKDLGAKLCGPSSIYLAKIVKSCITSVELCTTLHKTVKPLKTCIGVDPCMTLLKQMFVRKR